MSRPRGSRGRSLEPAPRPKDVVLIFNKLVGYEKQIVRPHLKNSKAFIEMQPTLENVKDDISIDIDSLSFILDTEYRNLLGEISVYLSVYRNTLEAINQRSNIHIHQVQTKLENAEFIEGKCYPIEHIEKILGDRLTSIMKDSTQQVIELTTDLITSNDDITYKLESALKNLYPNHDIITSSRENEA